MYSLFAGWDSHFETHEKNKKKETSFWKSFSSRLVGDFKETLEHCLYLEVHLFLFSCNAQLPCPYSTVTALVFRYSSRASIPRSFPNPDCLKPPNGEATSVLL